MSDQAGLAVPKDRQDVTVRLDNGSRLEGTIFLEYAGDQLTVHDRVAAFVEDGNNFFPLALKDASRTEFIQKKNVRSIEVDYAADQEHVDNKLALMHRVSITAIFTDESFVRGTLIEEVPIEKARLSDCLNLPNRFLHVKPETAETRICYINKELLLKVIYAPGS